MPSAAKTCVVNLSWVADSMRTLRLNRWFEQHLDKTASRAGLPWKVWFWSCAGTDTFADRCRQAEPRCNYEFDLRHDFGPLPRAHVALPVPIMAAALTTAGHNAAALLEATLEDVERKRHKKNPFDDRFLGFCLSRYEELVPSSAFQVAPAVDDDGVQEVAESDEDMDGSDSTGVAVQAQAVATAAAQIHARLEVGGEQVESAGQCRTWHAWEHKPHKASVDYCHGQVHGAGTE